MQVRTYQPGDESAQVAIYNEAAASLPHFKPAGLQEVRRRTQAADFDPGMRFVAHENGQPLGYVNFNANGRMSYPWCRKGCERAAEPLFEAMLQTLRQRRIKNVFAAYRADWQPVLDFFTRHGFKQTREMINFAIELVEMPTPPARPSSAIRPLQREDVPELLKLCPELFRVKTAEELTKNLFDNPYFPPDSLYCLRDRSNQTVVAAGILVLNPTYADPTVVDSNMPCFRLGAFGTENMQTKRLNGVFSFAARMDRNLTPLGLDLMGQAAFRLQETDDVSVLAAQAPSDVPALVHFYQRNFRRQGSFPVLEMAIS